jgi:hypothetical protein
MIQYSSTEVHVEINQAVYNAQPIVVVLEEVLMRVVYIFKASESLCQL